MSLIRKVFRRIQDGTLRSTVLETRWIYRHTRAYWRAVVLYTVLGLCATGLSMGIALVSKSLTNAIIAATATPCSGWESASSRSGW